MTQGMLERIGSAVWGWPMMILLVGVGVLFTVRLRGLQFRRLGQALRLIFRRAEGECSSYSALCTALAATIGTGNIVGVATAMAAGGPGALFWMVLTALFGMATQYVEGFLAVKYRRKTPGGLFGGPFCYIEQGLGKRFRPLAVGFAVIGSAVGILGVGTVTQVNSITSTAERFFGSDGPAMVLFGRNYSWSVVLTGLAVTILSALVLLGGAKRVRSACEFIVPFMSVLYITVCLAILLRNLPEIPAALRLIVKSAFAPRAALGAAAGIGLRQVLRMGIGRGVFTNEAGLGTSPIAAATAGTDPVAQGLVTMTGTFIDTVVICSLTGLTLVVTNAWNSGLDGAQIADYAWRVALPLPESLSSFLMFLCLTFFAFATIIGWNFYGERCLIYLTGGKGVRLYRAAYLLSVAVGPFFTVSAAWELADILNAFLAVPNLTALLLLQNACVRETRDGLKEISGKAMKK